MYTYTRIRVHASRKYDGEEIVFALLLHFILIVSTTARQPYTKKRKANESLRNYVLSTRNRYSILHIYL